MTQHFDDGSIRRRLEADKDRVHRLIEGPHEQAPEAFERERDVAILEQLEHDLAEIEAALQRLDEGAYGDEVVGGAIAADGVEAPGVERANSDSANSDSASS